MNKSFMKFHLPPILFKALAACWVGALSLGSSAAAKVMLSDISMTTYADFGQNKGRYAVGEHVNALLQAIREQEGGVRITYTNGLPDYTLQHGMVDFSSGDTQQVGVLIAPGTVATVAHNGVLTPTFSAAGIRYQCVEYNNSSVFSNQEGVVDYKVSRTNKLVTDATATPMYMSGGNDLTGQLLYHAGSGGMVYGPLGQGQSISYGSGQYVTGGITTITSSSVQGETGSRQCINLTGVSDSEPLAFQGQGGDSGSPTYIWNEATKQYEYLNALQAIAGTETYVNGDTVWAQEQAETGCRDTLQLGNTHSLSFAAGATAGEGAEDTFIKGKDIPEATYSATAYTLEIVGTGLSMSVLADKMTEAELPIYTWAALNDVRDKDDWYTYGNGYFNASDNADTPADKRSYTELFLTRDTCFRAADSETYTLSFDRMIDTGIGYTEFAAAEGQTADFVLQSVDGTSGQLLTAGYVVGKGVALHLQFTNAADYLREWRKIGEGDLYIDGEGGDNHILLNLGGSGATYLDRRDAEGNSAMAAYSVIINTGSTLVLRGGVDQVGRLVTLGSGGATLDFAGHSMEWNAGAEASAPGFNIQALTEEGIITNSGAGTTTLTVTDAGAESFLGSFRDQAGAGALKIVYNADAAWTWNGIATDLSNTGSGVEVQRGTLTLAGTLTEHGKGSYDGRPLISWNKWELRAAGSADDWHYADASMPVSISGGSFCLGSHARLTGDVSVSDGGTFTMREGVRHNLEYVEGGEGLEHTAMYRAFYGLKGDVLLQGGESRMVVSFSGETDAVNVYSGSIRGAGSLSIDAAQGVLVLAGDNRAHTGTKKLTGGTLMLNSEAAMGDVTTNRWVVGADAFVAFGGSMQTLLDALDRSSTGTLALWQQQDSQLDLSSHEYMSVGALRARSITYGNSAEHINGTLRVNSEGELRLAAQLVAGSRLEAQGRLTLLSADNTVASLSIGRQGLALGAGSQLSVSGGVTLAEGANLLLGSGSVLKLQSSLYGSDDKTQAENFARFVNAVSGAGTVQLQGEGELKLQLANSSVAPPTFRAHYHVAGDMWLQKWGSASSWVVAEGGSLDVSGLLKVSNQQTLELQRGGSVSASTLSLGLYDNGSYYGKLLSAGGELRIGKLAFEGTHEANSAVISDSRLHFTTTDTSASVLSGSGSVSISNSVLSSDHGFTITHGLTEETYPNLSLSNSTLDATGGAISIKDMYLDVSGKLTITGGSVSLSESRADHATKLHSGSFVLEQGSSLTLSGTVQLDMSDAIATGTYRVGTDPNANGYLTAQTGWVVEKVIDKQKGGTLSSSAFWKLADGDNILWGSLSDDGSVSFTVAETAVNSKVFYVNGMVFSSSDYAEATGFVVRSGGTLYLTESTAGTLSLGEALHGARGSGTIIIGKGTAGEGAGSREVTLPTSASDTTFRGVVQLNSDVAFRIGIPPVEDDKKTPDIDETQERVQAQQADLSSLSGLISRGASIWYDATGEGRFNNFSTDNYYGTILSTDMTICSTTSSGRLVFGGTTTLKAELNMETVYESHVCIEKLAGTAALNIKGGSHEWYAQDCTVNIGSLENYTGTLSLQRMREQTDYYGNTTRLIADLWSGENGAALGGLSLDSGAEATVHAQAATSLGSVTMSNSLGLAPRNTLTLQSGGKRISADSIAGVGDVVLCGSGALSVGRAELRSIGGGQAALSSSGYMSMSASGLSGAALSAAELSICGADSTESTLTYTLDRVYMDDGSVLDLSQGSMVTASASVFSSVRMDASSSLTGSALITGDVHLVLSLTELGDIDTTKVVSCDRLRGMVLGAGSTLTLDFRELENLMSDPQTDGLCVVLEGVQWESGDALFGLAATRSLWGPAAFSCDGTNTYVTFGAVVPEPATATLSLLALAALAARRRRR